MCHCIQNIYMVINKATWFDFLLFEGKAGICSMYMAVWMMWIDLGAE